MIFLSLLCSGVLLIRSRQDAAGGFAFGASVIDYAQTGRIAKP
jgi:hypothetical protein